MQPVDEIMSIAAAVNQHDDHDNEEETVTVLSESGGDGSSPPSTNNSTTAIDTNKQMMRRTRTILTPYQSRVLRRVLEQTLFPSTELRNSLASMLGIKPRTIQIWFQNQRQKAKLRTNSSANQSTSVVLGEIEDQMTSSENSGQASVRRESCGSSPTNSINSSIHLIDTSNANVKCEGGVRWVQFHHGMHPGTIPRQHAIVMQAIPAGHAHVQPMHLPQTYNNNPQYYTPHQPRPTYQQQYEPDHPDTTPRGGLDILASIASITTTVSDLEHHHHHHNQRLAGRLVPKQPQQ